MGFFSGLMEIGSSVLSRDPMGAIKGIGDMFGGGSSLGGASSSLTEGAMMRLLNGGSGINFGGDSSDDS